MQRASRSGGRPGSGPGALRLSASAETSHSPKQRAWMAYRSAAGHPCPALRREQCLAPRHKRLRMRHFRGAGRIRAGLRVEHSLVASEGSSGAPVGCLRRPSRRQGARANPSTRYPRRQPAPWAAEQTTGDLRPASRSSTHHTLPRPCGRPTPQHLPRQHRAAATPCRRDKLHGDQLSYKKEFVTCR